MGTGTSRSSSESHVSENGSANAGGQGSFKNKVQPQPALPSSRRTQQGTETSKKDEPISKAPSHPKLTTQSTLSNSKKESPNVKHRSEISNHGNETPPTPHHVQREQQQYDPEGMNDNFDVLSMGGGGNRLKQKFTLATPAQCPPSEQVLVKMGTSMLRTKNCSEEFQSLDLGEPIVQGKFDHDKSRNLHPLALERYCLVESSSVSGFSTFSSTSASAGTEKQPPIAQRDAAKGSLYRLSEGLPLYWLHAASAADMHNGAAKLKEAGFDGASVFVCAADPVIFAKPVEENKKANNEAKKNVFICLPALVRAAPPSRSLYVPGRVKLSQLERDIKMSIIHLVAQDVASGGTFPAYFGSKTTASQDAMSIGWTLGKVSAAFADDINTAAGAAAEEFELLKPRIDRIQTVASSANEGACLDESEMNTISKALLMNYYEKLSHTQPVDQAGVDNSPVFEDNCQAIPKTAVVVVTFEDLSPDTCFVLLLSAIAVTLQQEPVPILYRKLFEEVPPFRLSEVVKSFAAPQPAQIATHFDEFITQIISRLFTGSTSAGAYFISTNRTNIVRYAYTFLFSYYCYDIYVKKSASLTFSKWLRRHYLCYRSLAAISAPVLDILEMTYLQAPVYLIAENDGVPVMSIVSSDFGVRAHGFRKIPPAPVYGSQSPTVEELTAIAEYCAVVGKRWRHTAVVWCDLRANAVVYIDGKPHVVANSLGHPVTDDKVITSPSDLEQVEEYFKNNLFKSIQPTYAKRNAGILTTLEKKEPPTAVLTPREMAASLHLMPRSTSVEASSPKVFSQPQIVYYRLPVNDEKAPSEDVLQELISIILSQQSIYVDEDGPAFLFTSASGIGAVTVTMIAATLITYHLNGFPFGCHVGEEERVSIKNVQYTQGNFQAVRELVEQLPRGNQIKREVDAVLDACWDRMTSTFYHLREIIFATFSKVFTEETTNANANTQQSAEATYKQSVDYLERYVLLIIFNGYLHAKKHETGGWQNHTFQDWLAELAAANSPLISTLDNLCFPEFGDENLATKWRHIRARWLHGTTLQKTLDD